MRNIKIMKALTLLIIISSLIFGGLGCEKKKVEGEKKRPTYTINLISVAGGYDRETDGKDWWYWTSKSLIFKYEILGELSKLRKAQLKFTYLPATPERVVKIIITGKKVTELTVKMKAGWHEYISLPIDIDSSDVSIKIISEGEPVRLSDKDPRVASFLIKNFELVGIDQK